MSDYYVIKNGELYHYGVKGMKWGIKKAVQQVGTRFRKSGYDAFRVSSRRLKANVSSTARATQQNVDAQRQARINKAKKAVKIGAVVAGAALAVYGAKKLNDVMRDYNIERTRRIIDQVNRAHDLSYQRYWLSQNR